MKNVLNLLIFYLIMAEKTKKSSSGVEPKLAALLSWLFTPISSVIFMVLEDTKDDKFVSYNAKLSLYVGLVQIALFVLVFIPCLGWVIVGLGSTLITVMRIVWGVKSYQGEEVQVPVLTDMVKGK